MVYGSVDVLYFIADVIGTAAFLKGAIYRRVWSQWRNKFDYGIPVAPTKEANGNVLGVINKRAG
jgi:hypothetical protein